jgi:hypothetical protein
MASRAYVCNGAADCFGACLEDGRSADKMAGPMGATGESLALQVAAIVGSDTPLRVHSADPVETWTVSAAPYVASLEVE